MAKNGKRCKWITDDEVLVETHVRNSITGHECISKRDLKRSCVPLLDAIVRILLALGLIVALIFLAKSMESVALMQLSKSCDECVAKTIEMTNRLYVVSAYLQAYSKHLDEMDKRFDEIESRLHVTTNLMQECSMRMDMITNRLAKVECLLCKIEQKPCVLKIDGCCNCLWPCCLWKVGRQ